METVILVENRKARFEFELFTRFEAGISLLGWEVKALRAKRVSLIDSFVLITQNRANLERMSIQALPEANKLHPVPKPLRTKSLLLHRREIGKIRGHIAEKGMVCIPTKVYTKGTLIKVEIALGKGKKAHDKRQTIKDRDWKREQSRRYSAR